MLLTVPDQQQPTASTRQYSSSQTSRLSALSSPVSTDQRHRPSRTDTVSHTDGHHQRHKTKRPRQLRTSTPTDSDNANTKRETTLHRLYPSTKDSPTPTSRLRFLTDQTSASRQDIASRQAINETQTPQPTLTLTRTDTVSETPRQTRQANCCRLSIQSTIN